MSSMDGVPAAIAAESAAAASVADTTRTVIAPRSAGREESRVVYFCDWPIVRPKLISPLSMRMLNPHSGLLQTHAL